jgi:DNA end-binding protein Ku
MAARSSWKGYLKLSLVSCAVALYPANTTAERIRFNNLNRETGNRLKQQMVDAETGDVVEREDRVKGFEVSKGHYVEVEDEEIDDLAIESSHTIDIERFVPSGEVDPVFLDGSHYLAPDDKVAEEAFAVIREAMAQEDVVGIGRLVLARRERIIVLQPRGKGMLLTSLRYKYEVRDAVPIFDPIEDVDVPEDMLDLATHIIGRKKGHFDPAEYEDRYEKALVEMLRAKGQGTPVRAPEQAPRPSNVVNLMDALKRSIEAEKGGDHEDETPRRRPAAKSQSAAKGSSAKRAPAKSAPAAKGGRKTAPKRAARA